MQRWRNGGTWLENIWDVAVGGVTQQNFGGVRQHWPVRDWHQE